jgi:hypothetical protein
MHEGFIGHGRRLVVKPGCEEPICMVRVLGDSLRTGRRFTPASLRGK